MNSRSIVLTCIKSLLLFNHCICTFDLFFTFVSCLLTVTLHIVDVRLTCLINITYLLTNLVTPLTNLGGSCDVVVVGGVDVRNGCDLTLRVDQFDLVERSTAGRRHERTLGVMGVIVPETVVVVLRSLRPAARQLHAVAQRIQCVPEIT